MSVRTLAAQHGAYFSAVKAHAVFLLRSYLMDEDMIEPCVRKGFDRSQMFARVRTA